MVCLFSSYLDVKNQEKRGGATSPKAEFAVQYTVHSQNSLQTSNGQFTNSLGVLHG